MTIESVLGDIMSEEMLYKFSTERVVLGKDVLLVSDYIDVLDLSFVGYAKKRVCDGIETYVISGIKDWTAIDEYIKYHGDDYYDYEGEVLDRRVFVSTFDDRIADMLYDVRRSVCDMLEKVIDDVDSINFEI